MNAHRLVDAKVIIIVIAGVLLASGIFYSNNSSESVATNSPRGIMPQPNLPKPKPKPYKFPDGGTTIFPKYRLVGLYGTPGEPVLGVLGHQSIDKSIARVKKLANSYQKYSKQKILPTFEIISTVASATPTENNDYSRAIDPASLLPWIKAAKAQGVYVVLDLQPGRSSFITQVKQYESLLKYPNVGLALDPEWRLGPDQVPLVQIGAVKISEVNATAKWLSNLTQKNRLPQKLFLLHEFMLSMLPDRTKLNTGYKNLAYTVQMDGQGTQTEKLETWKSIRAEAPKNVHFGWKNFYAKDLPMRSIKSTMLLEPTPWYVSYQ